jgi:drug/metabolite transporter (DMT)-like permease
MPVSANTKRSALFIGAGLTFMGAILFSTKAIIVKKAFNNIRVDPVSLLTMRMLLSLPFYAGAVLLSRYRQQHTPLTQRQWGITIGLGLIGYYCSSLFDFLGLQYISAGLERLILFLYPTFTVLINRYVFRQPLLPVQRWALLLTYTGIGLAYFGEMRIDSNNPMFYLGSFLVFLCAITYAIYIAGSGYIIPKVGVTRFTAYAMLSATGGIFLHYLFRGQHTLFLYGAPLWWYGLLLAVVATVVPSFLISAGLKRVGASNVAIISSIGPISTILQAHFILGEPIGFWQIAGTVLVIAGILLISRKKAIPVT